MEAVKKLVDLIKPIKELAAIVAFFAAGAIFAVTYFVAQKSFNHEVLTLNNRISSDVQRIQCMLMAHVDILNYQDVENRFEDLRPRMIEIIADVEIKEKTGGATAADVEKRKEAEMSLQDHDARLRELRAKRDQANSRMAECTATAR